MYNTENWYAISHVESSIYSNFISSTFQKERFKNLLWMWFLLQFFLKRLHVKRIPMKEHFDSGMCINVNLGFTDRKAVLYQQSWPFSFVIFMCWSKGDDFGKWLEVAASDVPQSLVFVISVHPDAQLITNRRAFCLGDIWKKIRSNCLVIVFFFWQQFSSTVLL